MPTIFSSHELILRLAQQNQPQYIEALYSYRSTLHRGTPAPFMIVHGILAQHLKEYSHIVEQIRTDASSQDIFGQASECSEWRKP